MKKVALLLITILVVCGCEKKNENDILFPSNILKIKGSDVCMFDDLSTGDGVVVKSYCADSILLTDSNENSYDLKTLFKEGKRNINDIVEGLVIKEEIKDGSVVLYDEQHPEYTVIKCGEKYPNDYAIVYSMDYNSVFCEL